MAPTPLPTGQVEYTVAMNEDPDPRASFINCQSSFVLQDAYARDRVLQDELQELEDLRIEYEKYTQLLAFWDHILKMRKFGTPPEPPPPPPPPPYPALPGTNLLIGPPAPPKLVTPEEQTQQFLQRQSEIALRIADLTELIGTCVPSATTTCGLPANEVRRVGGCWHLPALPALCCTVGPQTIMIACPLEFHTLSFAHPEQPRRSHRLSRRVFAPFSLFLTRSLTPPFSHPDGQPEAMAATAGVCPPFQNGSRDAMMWNHHRDHDSDPAGSRPGGRAVEF